MDSKKIIITIFIIIVIIIGIVVISSNNVFKSDKKVSNEIYDNAKLDDYNDIWKKSNCALSREENGSLFARGSESEWFGLWLTPDGGDNFWLFETPFTLEFDILNETFRNYIHIGDKNQHSELQFNEHPNRGVGHWKIIVEDGSQKYYQNDNLRFSDNKTFSKDIRVGFVGVYDEGKNASTLKFANFKKY